MTNENKGFEISNSMVMAIVSVIGAVVAALAGVGAYQCHQQETKALVSGENDNFGIDADVVNAYVAEEVETTEE